MTPQASVHPAARAVAEEHVFLVRRAQVIDLCDGLVRAWNTVRAQNRGVPSVEAVVEALRLESALPTQWVKILTGEPLRAQTSHGTPDSSTASHRSPPCSAPARKRLGRTGQGRSVKADAWARLTPESHRCCHPSCRASECRTRRRRTSQTLRPARSPAAAEPARTRPGGRAGPPSGAADRLQQEVSCICPIEWAEISHEVCWSVLLSRRMVGTDRSPCVKVEPDERSAVRCHVTLPCWAQYTASTQKDR